MEMETVNQKSLTAKESKPNPTRVFGWASFFNDFGSDMVFPVWPTFVTQTLGASASFLGFLDGFGEALVAFSKLLSGILADQLRSYQAAHRAIMPSVAHDTERYANNRADDSAGQPQTVPPSLQRRQVDSTHELGGAGRLHLRFDATTEP
jgi:hypothetical protein